MKYRQTRLQVGELATGQALNVPIFDFDGRDKTAPNVFIQANVHGAEVQGNAVIFQLMSLLETYDILGDIRILPLANPLGINQKSGEFTLGRFDPITGMNWNREYQAPVIELAQWFERHQALDDAALIKAYRQELVNICLQGLDNEWGLSTGKRLALNLQALAHEADIVLDLHTGPKSCKHLYCPEYDIKAARYFSIPYTLVIPNEFGGAMDESIFCPWWQLSDFLKCQGRNLDVPISAFTLELGSQEHIDLAEALNDAKGILAYLSHRGVIKEKLTPQVMPRYACYLKHYKKYHAPLSGLVEYKAPLGKVLPEGQVLANILRLDLYGTEQVLTPLTLNQTCVPILHFASASVHQGTELYKVMTQVFELSFLI
ncbi:succinylglutamate desuccinylase/aspartoacylase family protein [Shewanella surugensis]|uniref:M14 family metallopeptidase n=1 Tax=Shewanella surugensis TaxID=212020 RepID=A0ABT0LI40_9GAMM|nr:succinylglutamate desuccinylase/aspartoacylase family protein [Shewanella surugensis]MCL1126972.1 M14 family metallopeptidase [Shewanella surugensis]